MINVYMRLQTAMPTMVLGNIAPAVKSRILALVKGYHNIFLFLLLFCSSLTGIGQQYFFQSYGQKEGIPVSTVNDIAEDELGFMWVATEGGGLARFDGQNSVVYTTENGLPSNYVTSLIFRHDKGLLVGTDKGFRFFNGQTFEDPFNVPSDRVFDMCTHGDSILLVLRRSLVIVLPSGELETLELPDNQEIMSVACAKDLFVGASDGLWKYEEGDWVKWWEGRNVRSIFIPENENYSGTIQVGAADDVYLILRKGVGVKNLSSGTLDTEAHPDVRDIVHDNYGRWWYGSYQRGLRRYDASQQDGYRGVTITEEQGLSTPKVRCLFVSSDGRIWIGGLSGLSRLVEPDLFRYTSEDGLGDERVHALCVTRNGDWWMGGLSGLSRKTIKGDFTTYDESDGVPSGLIFDITETQDGDLWIATENGLAKKVGNRFVKYGSTGGLDNAFVFDIDAYANGDLVIATTQGIYRYNGIRFSQIDPNLQSTAISHVQVDEDGQLWALDIEGRILVFDGQDWEYPIREEIMLRISTSTFQVENGVLWLATNGHGLWRLEGDRLDSITTTRGLLSDNVWSLDVVDNDAWIGSELGIQNVIWQGGWTFGTRVSEARGFGSMECNPHSVQRSDRSIIFGTNQGLLVAPLRSSHNRDAVGTIRLLRLDLYFQQPEDWGLWTDSISPWTGMPQDLVLPYDQNYLRFAYSAMGVADPNELQYEYKLSPLSEDWVNAEHNTEAIFTSVSPGKYTFEVRAYDPLSGRTLASDVYRFAIKPPFWKTWWFYVLFVAAVVGIVVTYVRVRLSRVRSMLALEEERNDLERRALRLQMNPHFVFNALDAISGFIFKNEPKEAVKYLNSFAKLMRLMLESSREHVIPVHTEIQLLENYLSLEKLRFSGEFDSEIIIDEELDTYGSSMPSMMVQPHIENAILHGLRPKGGGKVTVHFEQTDEGKGLRCVIEDNGVGRKRAAEIRENSGRNHRSLAGEISRRRVELFEKTYGGRSAVIVQDLHDQNGNPSGTRVVLQLPLQNTDEWDDD
ncbi:MAG: hypothetical protein EP346_01250 [Bacteroidetes bacterium]|nr:MAG: hypothetical protein EP346_01250 [Bacteroidota bacterium]